MTTELRDTGISAVGPAPWGTHFCHFYETKQDLLDTVVPYFKAGLESKEFCLWVISDSDSVTVEEAKGALAEAVPDLERHLSDGDIEVLVGLGWYLEDNVFNLERVTRAWDAKLKRALARGYDGMRVSGDTLWLTEKHWKDFNVYEKQLNDSIIDRPMTVLCTYPLTRSGAALVLDVAKTHQFAIARRQGEWEVIESPELIKARAEIARHKQAEDELRRQKEILQKIFDHIPVMINFVGADGSIKLLNREWERTLGWTLGEIREQNVDVFAECYPDPQYRQQVLKFVTEAKGEWRDFKTRVRDGRVMDQTWVRVRLSDGTSVGIGKDITERKRAEALLHAKEQEFRAIVENAPDQIIRYDRDFRRTYVNPAVAHFYGLPVEALIGKPIGSNIPQAGAKVKEDEVADVRQRIADVFNTGKTHDYELTWTMPTGRAYFSVRLFPERDLDGSVVNVLGISRDITERKQAGEALDERLRFETLVTELSAAFASLSPNEVDREIDKWLQTLAEFLGVDRASFLELGENWTTLYRSHSYTVPGIEPLPPPPIRLTDKFPWITDQLRRGVTVKWSRVPDDMPEEAAKEKEYAAKLGVKSGLNIPVRVGGSFICAITFTSIVAYRDWPDAMVARLRLVGEIFAAAVERKRAEGTLRESEERFRQMAENIREVFWLITADMSKTLYISPAYEVVWGQSSESLYREPNSFYATIHAEDRARVVAVVERDFEQGFEVEYRAIRPDGSIRWIRDRGFPIKDEAGRIYRIAGIAEDITESKRAEEELQKEKEILEKIFENIPVMIGFVGEDGRVRLVNPEWERTIGWTLKELEEQNVDIFVEAYPDVSYRQEVLDFVAASTGEWIDLKIRVRDGRMIDAACAFVHLLDGTRVAIAQDITERKQAEEKLKQSEIQFAEAQRLAHVGSFEWNLGSNAVTWSDELYRIFGLKPGAINIVGDAMSFIHADDRDLVLSTVKDAVENKQPYSFHYRVLRPDGEERVLHSRASIMSDEYGTPIRVFGATQDVTGLKRAEENLKATSAQLRALSARLQTAKEEEGIRIAREIHDELGSSLTRLKWDLELISREDMGNAGIVNLDQKINDMIQLVDATVDTVRRISAELRPKALDDLGLAAALRLESRQFQERTGIVTKCECSLDKVRLTPQQSTALFRICEEALTNVIRHSGATQVEIKLWMDEGDLLLTISDNGRGITPAEIANRLSLGLLGMRERIHLIAGEIDIQAVEGKGTLVTARVPISMES
jgi:PAS domain S-box-containing protein